MVGVGEIIAGAVVKAVIGKLTQPVRDEIALQWGHKAEVDKIVEKLKDFEAFMHDADDRLRRGGTDGAASRRWLAKLKSVAYDIEDVLDDLDAPDSQPKVCEVVKWISKPHKMVKVKNKVEELAKDHHNLKLVRREARPGGSTNNETIGANNGMVGRVKEMDKIISLLLGSEDQEDISIIPIVGLGGIGKTTLAQSVFTDEKVVNFFNLRVWVHVTKDLDLSKIGYTIMEELNGEPKLPNSSFNLLCNNLKKLATTRYLIVLDDLWEEDDYVLDKLKLMLKHGSKGSKIIVTTRNLSVVQKLYIGSPAPGKKVCPVSPSDQIILDILSPGECWDLMKIKALGSLDYQSGLDEIGMQIAQKCGGLPLVVNALGKVMSESRDMKIWTDIRDTKVELGLRAEHQDKTLECLMLSYYYMKREFKLCFNYLAAFPKGFVMSSDLLIKQWNALGYIQPGYDGNNCINYFIGMSFLQPSGSMVGTSSVTVIMHDLVHEVASIITADEFLVLDAREQKKWNLSIHCRHVQLIKYKNQFHVFKHLPHKLRSLHFRNSHELQLPKKAFSRFKYIRILDLSSPLQNICPIVSICSVPDNICNLYKLCYLDLSGNRSLHKLPTSLGKLSKLSFLNLSGCSFLKELPKSIIQLTCLQHLDMSECRGIQYLPDKFGSLPNILFLSMSGCSELTKLPDSVSLKSLKNLNLSNCHKLQNLPKDFGNLVELQFLNLSGCYKISVLPESFCQLTQLKDLNLSDCHDLKELPCHFGEVSNLDTLNLTSCSKLQLLPESLYKLSKLRDLNLSYCMRLKRLPSSIGELKLHILDINSALALTDINGINTMTSLTNFKFTGVKAKLCKDAEAIQKRLNLPARTTHTVHKAENNRCSNIAKLAKLTCRELEVVQLQNVRDPEDAENVMLRDKSELRTLCLGWQTEMEDISDLQMEDFSFYLEQKFCKQPGQYKSLLSRLVPPRDLDLFLLHGYMDKDFPNWMSDISSYLPFLTVLVIRDLQECETLPPFGQLPNLRSICLDNCPNIRKISREFYGDGGACMKLRSLTLKSMENLVEWWTTQSSRENGEFLIPNLHSLDLQDCPSLKFLPYPPRSIYWALNNSDEVFPEGGFGSLSASLSPFKMLIQNCNSPSKWHRLQHFPSLEEFGVQSCSSLRALPEAIGCFTSLRELFLLSLEKLEAIPECLGLLTSLDYIFISDCPKLTSLPQSIKDLTSLRLLSLMGCTGLKMLPEGVGQLISLQVLHISACPNMTYLPKSMNNLSTLRRICFDKCPGLDELPEWLGQQTSLQELTIILCPNLPSLPESIGNLTMLRKLHIEGCPILVGRCQREDAHKISHIPEVTLRNVGEHGSTSGVARVSTSRDPVIDPEAGSTPLPPGKQIRKIRKFVPRPARS